MTRQRYPWHIQNFSRIEQIVEEKRRKNVIHTHIHTYIHTHKSDRYSPADFVSRAKKYLLHRVKAKRQGQILEHAMADNTSEGLEDAQCEIIRHVKRDSFGELKSIFIRTAASRDFT